jgi:adenosylcobinamide kinase / adenosylcobinamide-phosphate guanylyltransferase
VAWRRVFLLGGARSGKSAFAERLALECGSPIVYVATATAVDEEMAQRIEHHRARRLDTWQTVEARTGLVNALASHSRVNTVLVEDLTLLLSNHMEEHVDEAEALTVHEVEDLLRLEANLVLVSNEVGMGLVPSTTLGRTFRDALGRVNQAAASLCGEVYLVAAGLPLRMK